MAGTYKYVTTSAKNYNWDSFHDPIQPNDCQLWTLVTTSVVYNMSCYVTIWTWRLGPVGA